MYQHFKAIAQHLTCRKFCIMCRPVLVDMLPETVGRLAKVKNLVGIKRQQGT
ncbi:dihydrodipicolinate synthase family protein [Shigella flexneri]